MGTSAAMVQLKVVKAGGAGSPADMKCSEILACFDPPIEFGSHSQMVGSKTGYQAEHVIPTSAMHDLGRGGTKFPGCEGYSTGGALTFMAGDGQTEGFEHKILTDQMRKFSQQNDLVNRNAPMKEWLQEYKQGAKEALDVGRPPRTINRPDLDRDALIDAAAECITLAAAESFANLDKPIKPETPLRNPWPATQEQIKAAARGLGRGGGAP
ncbi:hypothetical protein [Mitsuaria sp. GD03876]|uniref:hypothetical protein n=1 Tax=Mitsuaria sp. GD03876 TaxID=2975399 RepID=UPI00244BFBE2|nr:hypothetical protein [Mitsuaria sp. GD03876]MDH0868122.1 hypothetical protein [Mitsuaria sp. GD03876]